MLEISNDWRFKVIRSVSKMNATVPEIAPEIGCKYLSIVLLKFDEKFYQHGSVRQKELNEGLCNVFLFQYLSVIFCLILSMVQ